MTRLQVSTDRQEGASDGYMRKHSPLTLSLPGFVLFSLITLPWLACHDLGSDSTALGKGVLVMPNILAILEFVVSQGVMALPCHLYLGGKEGGWRVRDQCGLLSKSLALQ